MLKKILSVSISVAIAFSMAACTKSAKDDQKFEKSATKMDTVMRLTAYGSKGDKAIEAAYKRIDEIEQMASANIDSSDVNKINQAAGKSFVKVHPEIIKMIKASIKYSELSQGAFDITVAPLIKLWGIGTENQRVPADTEIKQKLALVGYKNISINEADNSVKLEREGMAIDLGGIAKGFTADEVVKIFQKNGIKSGIINLGGSSIYTLGTKPDGSLWSVGIRHPRNDLADNYLGIIKMPENALSTSGDYERYFMVDGKRYHHILNPATGYPAEAGVMSDTIVIDKNIPDCNMIADILTKTSFVVGVEKGFKIIDGIQGVSNLAVTTDNKVFKSANWKSQLTILSSDFKLAN